MFLPENFCRAFLIYIFINNKIVQKRTLQVIASSLYVHSFCVFSKYEAFGDRSAEQPMAEPCFPTLV